MVFRNDGARAYAKSPSAKYPKPLDLCNHMLSQLREIGEQGVWIHIDARTAKGWVHDVLFGKHPWVEVQYRDDRTLSLNLPRKQPATIPPMPVSWKAEKRMWIVPRQESERLAEWINNFFVSATLRTDYQAGAYVEG